MIRQTRTYLVGAMSGATLIAIAIVSFVVLVSAQVFSDWPLSALRGGTDEAAVSSAKAPDGGGLAATAAAAAPAAGAASDGGSGSGKGGEGGSGGQPTVSESAAAHSAPSGGAGGQGGGGGSTGQGETGGSGSSPGAAGPSESSADGGSGTGGRAGSSGGGSGGGGATNSSPSRTVTEAVNDTVSGVDESTLGGALQSSGVTATAEGVVNGVAGPESTVGQVVDGTVEAVGGLLTPKR